MKAFVSSDKGPLIIHRLGRREGGGEYAGERSYGFKGPVIIYRLGGGRSIFVVTSEHLPDPPVEYLVF